MAPPPFRDQKAECFHVDFVFKAICHINLVLLMVPAQCLRPGFVFPSLLPRMPPEYDQVKTFGLTCLNISQFTKLRDK